MNPLPARRAVRSGREQSKTPDVIAAAARLVLFHAEYIKLDRATVEALCEQLYEFLSEVNDESPKV